MKKLMTGVIAAALLATSIAAVSSAQPLQTKSKAKAAATAEKSSVDARYRRLPSGFGSLELSDEQKEEIYSIRADYGQQIDDLNQKLQELRDEMNEKTEAVLSATQKRLLTSSRKAKVPVAEDEADAADEKEKPVTEKKTSAKTASSTTRKPASKKTDDE